MNRSVFTLQKQKILVYGAGGVREVDNLTDAMVAQEHSEFLPEVHLSLRFVRHRLMILAIS